MRLYRFVWITLFLSGLALSACAPAAATPSGPANTAAPQSQPTATDAAQAPSATAADPALPTATAAKPLAPDQDPYPTSAAPTLQPTLPAATVSELPDASLFVWAPFSSGLTRPTDLADVGGGRLLVLEQPGLVRVVENGTLLPQPFLDIRDRVGSGGNEQGLLGIALHPRYAENGQFFLNYTNLNGDTTVSRFSASGGSADPGSEQILLTVNQPYANHNGGSLAFGPDGYLYIGMGDGGSAGDPQNYGQDMGALLGKLLRIHVDAGDPYAIPADNPYADGSGGRAEIWASGLRNPWRFSFDRATGDLYIGDVGQNAWEEIDFQAAGTPGGVNFGWRYREAANPYSDGQPPAGLALTDPVAQYPHSEGCSVTGGFVYRGAALPELNGVYLYGDYCNGRVWGLLRLADGSWQNRTMFETGAFLSSFGQDASGELYALDQRAGALLVLRRAE